MAPTAACCVPTAGEAILDIFCGVVIEKVSGSSCIGVAGEPTGIVCGGGIKLFICGCCIAVTGDSIGEGILDGIDASKLDAIGEWLGGGGINV